MLVGARGVDAGCCFWSSIATTCARSIRANRSAWRRRAAELMEMSVGEGSYLHNPVTEIQVAEAPTLTHMRLQDESPAAFHLSTLMPKSPSAAPMTASR